MTISEILKALELYNGRFPLAAMEAAIAQREAITPELLRVVEAVAENPVECAKQEDYMLPLFAMYLLAQFREKRAYAPIIKIASAPRDTVDVLIGGTITEGLSQILASVYDGDPAPLRGLVENAAADEFVRNAALEAFLVLARVGELPREEVTGYMRELFREKLEREPSFIWDGLISAVADLPAPELIEEVRHAFAAGLANPGVASLEDIEDDLVNPKPWRTEKFTLITNAIDEMAWWAAFDPNEPWPRVDPKVYPPEYPPAGYPSPQPAVPIRREQPKIGRNESCPCGSGKKYKKCCGSA